MSVVEVSRIIRIADNGCDVWGDGSASNPYQTPEAATLYYPREPCAVFRNGEYIGCTTPVVKLLHVQPQRLRIDWGNALAWGSAILIVAFFWGAVAWVITS